jgi:Fe2+ transport system protein A
MRNFIIINEKRYHTQGTAEKECRTMRLSECMPGEKGKVVDLMVSATYEKRLLDLGLLPGTEVQVVRRAPLGGPIVVRVRGYQVCIRRAEAQHIEIDAVS